MPDNTFPKPYDSQIIFRPITFTPLEPFEQRFTYPQLRHCDTTWNNLTARTTPSHTPYCPQTHHTTTTLHLANSRKHSRSFFENTSTLKSNSYDTKYIPSTTLNATPASTTKTHPSPNPNSNLSHLNSTPCLSINIQTSLQLPPNNQTLLLDVPQPYPHILHPLLFSPQLHRGISQHQLPEQLPFKSTTTIICFQPEPNFRRYCIHNSNSSTNITQPQSPKSPTTSAHFTIHYEPPGTFFTKYVNVKPQPKTGPFYQRQHNRQIPNDSSAECFKAVGTPTPQKSAKDLFHTFHPKTVTIPFPNDLDNLRSDHNSNDDHHWKPDILGTFDQRLIRQYDSICPEPKHLRVSSLLNLKTSPYSYHPTKAPTPYAITTYSHK